VANQRCISSIEEFDEEYQRGEEWRECQVSDEVWERILERGLPPETILLSKTLPPSILRKLAQSPDPRIRSMVADKRAAKDLLPALAQDADPAVRSRVAWNKKTSRETLEKLAHDDSTEVRAAAEAALKR
jgi:hypothetical protein